MASVGEQQRLLLRQNGRSAAHANDWKRPPWQSYRHPEVKHELILYGELAALAAFIVALYVGALVPWEYVQRVQLVATRLQPPQVSAHAVHQLLNVCREAAEAYPHANLSDSIYYYLTSRPCGIEQAPSTKSMQPEECAMFRLGYPERYQNYIKSVSAHDHSALFHIPCCHEHETAPRCPCGFEFMVNELCYTTVQAVTDEKGVVDCGATGRQVVFESVQEMSTALKDFLTSKNVVEVCFADQRWRHLVDGHENGPCSDGMSSTLRTDDKDSLVLCVAEAERERGWWRPRPVLPD